MPRAGGFLWNPRMLLQVNCRGFVVAQHMQPEASKYSHAPVLEQATFMLPEAPHYAHHPGRFVYVRDRETGELFSLPYEPVRSRPDAFVFSVGTRDIRWHIEKTGIHADLVVRLTPDDVVELWELSIRNAGNRERHLDICTCFTIGYMSWMNQSAEYRSDLGGIVASSVTPYQKLDDYERVSSLKDRTFLLHDRQPDAWEAARDAFEGDGGLTAPDSLRGEMLGGGNASYEVPVGALQYHLDLPPGKAVPLRFLFGPARDCDEIRQLRTRFFDQQEFERVRPAYDDFMAPARGCLTIATPDAAFDGFVNHWLGRQVYYHGSANRFTTDPQTRNYLQDALGMVYIDPAVSRHALLTALSQQQADGGMPDGVVLSESAELKYINQVPHTDHCVWVPILLAAYLDETADQSLLDMEVTSGEKSSTVLERVTVAMRWLLANRDSRGLSLIGQGDWCDPMNMVGHEGKGVSGWLSIATVHALRLWADICRRADRDDLVAEMTTAADDTAAAVQSLLWDGNWFARGITDGGNSFGIAEDDEGRMYLNPQSWSMMANLATADQARRMLDAVDQHLDTPFGPMVLAPAYTAMREDIGRLTQKYPGVAENGSVYNHAVAFYIYALLGRGDANRAFDLIARMIPGPGETDLQVRGQLPVFVPNYYRGAVHQYPRTAGRSSQLFNTGAASWLYRSIVERVFGLRGNREGLIIDPALPDSWNEASAERRFRGGIARVHYRRDTSVDRMRITVNGASIDKPILAIAPGETIEVAVRLPAIN
jgi:cellobionic acid phosphorylase